MTITKKLTPEQTHKLSEITREVESCKDAIFGDMNVLGTIISGPELNEVITTLRRLSEYADELEHLEAEAKKVIGE